MNKSSGLPGFLRDIRLNKFSYFLALPAVLYVFVFNYATIPYMITAFQKFSYRTSILDNEFIGLENFKLFFSSPRALQVSINTVRLNFLFIFFGFAVSIILALLINEIRIKWFSRVNQTAFIFPYFLSWIICSYIVYAIFGTDLGLLNRIRMYFGLESINWYGIAPPWTWILVVLRVWKSTGINTVIFLAAITSIDQDLYEAGKLDGANRFQQAMRITLPLIMPTVITMALLNLGRLFYGDFGMIYSIIRDNGLLFPTVDVIDTYIFRLLRRTGDPSQAMAVGIYQSIMGFVLVYASNWLAKRVSDEGALF